VSQNNGGSIGDCATDAFAITSPGGNRPIPVICGDNGGQHCGIINQSENHLINDGYLVYLDASQSCYQAVFDLGSGSTDSRAWDIKGNHYFIINNDCIF